MTSMLRRRVIAPRRSAGSLSDWSSPVSITTGVTTTDVYPTLTQFPGAIWTRTGDKLTSPARRPFPVYNNADGFILGTTRPTLTNSGSRIPLGSLTPYVGTSGNLHELVTTSDGQVISGLYLDHARIRVRHTNVTIRDCIITIGYDAARAVIHNNPGIVCETVSFDTRGLTVEYVTIDPAGASSDGTQTSDWATYGIYMNGGIVYRCAMRNVVDGIAQDLYPLSGGGSEALHAWGNYIQTKWSTPDPNQSDNSTHNDCVQIAGGDGHSVIGNTMINPSGGILDPGGSGKTVLGNIVVITPYHPMVPTAAASISTKDAGFVTNMIIRWNWVSGAYTQMSAWLPYEEGGPGSAGMILVGNRHGGVCQWPILFTPAGSAAAKNVSGNIVDSSGLTWNGGGMAAGAPISPRVTPNTGGAATADTASTAFGGNDQIVEPGSTCYLLAKGSDATSTWVGTGAWSVVSNDGPAITVTSALSSDGKTVAQFATPKPTSTQTIVLRWTPTGVADTDDITVTIPPWQGP